MSHPETAVSQRKYFELVTELGREMLENGGEIFRTGDVMRYTAHSLGLENFHAFVIANGIFASMLAEGQTYSCHVQYISLSPVSICRLEALNTLSRRIVAGFRDPDAIRQELERISTMESYGNRMKILGAGFGSGGFCYLFGGSLFDSVTAFFAGMILYLFLLYLIPRLSLPRIMCTIASSIVAASACIVLHRMGMGHKLDQITIGAIFPLVPGIALTNSFRNFLENDYLAGLVRLADALMTAGGIAIGVGVAAMVLV